DFSWDARAFGWGVAATLPMLSVLVVVERWPVGPVKKIRDLFDELIRPLFRECSLAELALVSLLAGIGEEMLFRGLFQAGVPYWLGAGLGVVLARLPFGLFPPLPLG